MKKLICLLLLITLSLGLVCCVPSGDETKLRIGYLTGPTGMGMAKLISDDAENGKYIFTKYTDTTAAKADLAAGKVDIICLPTNEAAMYYSTAAHPVKVLAINCLNSLYLLSAGKEKVTSLSELEGRTVYTCKNGTPRVILEHIISKLGLDITVSYEINGKELVKPQDVSTYLTTGELPYAVIPEPLVTSTLLTIAKNADESVVYTVDIDLADEWADFCDTPIAMGCLLANADMLTKNKATVDSFLSEYKASVDYIANPDNLDSAANYIVETGIMAAVPAAKKALANLGSSICYIDGADMKNTLVAFYSALKMTQPVDDFYYEK